MPDQRENNLNGVKRLLYNMILFLLIRGTQLCPKDRTCMKQQSICALHMWLNLKRNNTGHRDQRILQTRTVDKASCMRKDMGWALNVMGERRASADWEEHCVLCRKWAHTSLEKMGCTLGKVDSTMPQTSGIAQSWITSPLTETGFIYKQQETFSK